MFSKPIVCEQEGTLSLRLGTDMSVQSEMRIDSPNRLMLGYTRVMMGFLLFVEHPKHIGMIGLGGGSIQKHAYQHLPKARISVAEINSEIIALRGKFSIPNDNYRFQVFHEDGAVFVKRDAGQFDVLVIDGFGAHGQPPQLCSREFYDDCYRSLARHGLLVVNFCETSPSILIRRLRQSFGQRVTAVAVDDSENVIAFAAKGDVWIEPVEEYWRRQARIERCHGIDLTETVRELFRSSSSLSSASH